ncbi:hypothetical protein DIPPA_09418 [Diplonema papillatum]|nr:hypothetical protein DIPPA_14018 [Diplonema papillatum]KAJ9439259.1 hypothetical protein DIPPA_15323 [Diplonema papillatum]KAJ9440794.1 hypothetical protein DIPPA_32239 [Diplonema papillatum]KAJ9448533.1 hypothetical protein DIPPA_10721 [Diplonema papillatum]KAJ9448586.1 hypothetical protein DIPPA_28057 [Diplonema papillatum]
MPVEVNPAGCAVVGGQYATAADFTDAVVEEAVATGRCLVRRRKEKGRVRFECSGTTSTGGACAFKCTAMLHADTETYHVSRADAHSCVFTTGSGDEKANELGRLHSEWVTRRIAAHVEAEPDLSVKGIVASMRTNGVTITSKVARLAKAQALQETGLDAASGFRKLRAYFAAVKCVDAEAVTSIDTKPGVATEEDANPWDVFGFAFLAFGACVHAARSAMFVSVDGTHLTHGGVLFVAVVLDPMQKVVPIAYALGQTEDTASWTSFLVQLKELLPEGFTLMSDRDKGLMSAVKTVLPTTLHLICVNHVVRNVSKSFGKGTQHHVWKLAHASSHESYAKILAIVSKENDDLACYLDKLRDCMSDAYLVGGCRCHHYTSNVSEGFNKNAKLARSAQNAINLFERLRIGLMHLFASRAGQFPTRDGATFVPWVEKRLGRIEYQARGFSATPAGRGEYEVKEAKSGRQQRVRVLNKGAVYKCTCVGQHVSQLPCVHIVCVCGQRKVHPLSLVDALYTVESLRSFYDVSVPTVLDVKTLALDNLAPPRHKNPSGRPKEKRIPSRGEIVDDDDLPFKGAKKRKVTCARCGGEGHYKVTCTNPPLPAKKDSKQDQDTEQDSKCQEPADSGEEAPPVPKPKGKKGQKDQKSTKPPASKPGRTNVTKGTSTGKPPANEQKPYQSRALTWVQTTGTELVLVPGDGDCFYSCLANVPNSQNMFFSAHNGDGRGSRTLRTILFQEVQNLEPETRALFKQRIQNGPDVQLRRGESKFDAWVRVQSAHRAWASTEAVLLAAIVFKVKIVLISVLQVPEAEQPRLTMFTHHPVEEPVSTVYLIHEDDLSGASDHFSLVRGKPSRQLLRKLPMQLRFNSALL